MKKKGRICLKRKKYLIILLCFTILFTTSTLLVYKYFIAKRSKLSFSPEEIGNTAAQENSKNEQPAEKPSISPEPTINVPAKTPPFEVIISSVGDVTIGTDDNFNKSTSLPVVYQKSNDPEYLFKNVSHIFKKDNLTTANLETTFTNSNTKRDKKFNFKGDPSLANSLVLGSIEAVNISNNHIYDYDKQGFNDTIKTLKDYNISYFGEGSKWTTSINGVKFGFLGYQGWSNDKKLLTQIKNDISALKAEGSVVIINFHWGEERKYTPNNIQKYLAHYSIDNGADLIIGHHPHVIQGIEKYKNRFIAYSLGNFCFGGNSNPSDKDTFILQSKFKFDDGKLDKIGIRVFPSSISSVSYKNDYQPTLLSGKEKIRVLENLNKLSINMDAEINEDYIYSH